MRKKDNMIQRIRCYGGGGVRKTRFIINDCE